MRELTRSGCALFAKSCAQRFGIKPLKERIVKGFGCGVVGGKIDLMKKKRKNILLIAGMLLVMLVSIFVYSFYTQKQIYQESTANLLSTYGQSAKTFTMFAQRNWNILTDWDGYLGTLAERGEQEGQWQEYIAQKATWLYTDFYLFNEQCEFWTTAGRQGTAEYMKATFEKL